LILIKVRCVLLMVYSMDSHEETTMRLSGTISEKGLHAFDGEPRVHAGHIILRVWVVVADQEKARFWRRAEHGFREIGMAEEHLHHHTYEHWHREVDNGSVFARKLADWLESAHEEEVFDRLILVASPRVIGALQDVISTNLRACIAAEIPKDLTGFEQKDLEKALEKIVTI
jgi:protein required for attachment to host cells